MNKNTRKIGISIVLAVLLLSAAFAGAAAADKPVLDKNPVFATGLTYTGNDQELIVSIPDDITTDLLQVSLDGKTWYHQISDIKKYIVGNNAGTYTVYYRAYRPGTKGDEYSATKSANVTIGKAKDPITLTARSLSKEYGSADPVLKIDFAGTTYNDSLNLSNYEAKRDSGENVGTYTIHVSRKANAPNDSIDTNYPVELKDGVFTITPLELSDITAGTIPNQVYTGSAITPKVSVSSTKNLTKGKDYEFSYKDNVNAGTATLTVNPKDGSNYTFTPIDVTFTILKADQKNAKVVMNDYIVGTTPSTPSLSGAKENPKATYYYTTSESASAGEKWNPSTPLSVGTYYIYAVLDPTDNYNGCTTEKTQFKVLKDTNTLTVTYTFADGTTASPTHTESVHVGNTYSVKSPEIDGYTPSESVVTGTMGNQDVKKTVLYSEKSGNYYSLTVTYLYKDGTAASPAYHARYLYGESYSVTSPSISGFIVSRDPVTGSMGNFDVVEPVYYTENSGVKHTLTIRYIYDNGINAAEPVADTYAENARYSVESPVITGYTPSESVVSGTMNSSDITKTVTYTVSTPAVHTVTVNYQYENGSTASPSNVASVEEGNTYLVSSPQISGYTPSREYVSGTMGTENIVDKVTYTQTGSSGGHENSSGGHSSVKTIYPGTYVGGNTYIFDYGDIVVTKIIVPIDSDTTQSVSWWEEDGAKPAGGWYQFEFDAPGFATGRFGTVYFQVSDAVISSHKLSGIGDHDVTLYRNGEKIPTYYEGSGNGYNYYTGEVSADGVYDIVFEAGSTLDHQTSSGSSQTGIGETPVKTASSPVPLAGILGGLAVIGVLAARMRR